jgi:hypothetical protein
MNVRPAAGAHGFVTDAGACARNGGDRRQAAAIANDSNFFIRTSIRQTGHDHASEGAGGKVGRIAWRLIARRRNSRPHVRNRLSLRKTGLIRTPQHSPPTNELCQYTDHGFAPDGRSRTSRLLQLFLPIHVVARMAHLELVTLVVSEYDEAIRFFVDVLQFELVEDTASLTNDGRPKRWVVVRPSGARTGVLLTRADGDRQRTIVGDQFAGRVGMFLQVDDFNSAFDRWDLLGPSPL